jgi:hypothetical protein
VIEGLSWNEHAVLLERRLLVGVGLLAAALFFLPFPVARTVLRGLGFVSGSAFFGAIGAAYMLMQAPWVQRFVLHLGHPAYATPAVLGGMLVGTGLGSLKVTRTVGRTRAAHGAEVALGRRVPPRSPCREVASRRLRSARKGNPQIPPQLRRRPSILASPRFASRCGSLAAGRVGLARSRVALVAIPFVLATTHLALAPVFDATAGTSLVVRVAVALLAVSPVGCLMGFAFPAGIARFGQARIAWFWAVNGFAAVVASVLSLALAMAFGLRAVGWLACALYGLAAVLVAIPEAANRRQA